MTRAVPGLLAVAGTVAATAGGAPSAAEQTAFFEQKIRPVLVEHCYECHSAGAKKLKGGLMLDTKQGWEKGGDSGEPAIIRGEAAKSLLIRTVLHEEEDLEMPPKKPKLPEAVIADLVAWVQMGAPDPREGVVAEAKRADKSWWSLQPLAHPEPPSPAGLPEAWSHNPVDRFLFAKMAEKGLSPSPTADRRTLIRRLSYDLTGLPPGAEEVEAFIADADPRAYEKLVDRLLDSPHYGEQWGRHWLDVVRFGESNGFERNFIINNAWPFRDYVIRSFNEDKPFNQFIIEHLAADVIAPGKPEVEIGSAFLTVGPYDDVANNDLVAQANIRAATLDDMITATGSAFLGLTINCARCHHHKFDPVPTEDYYRMRAAFEGVTHGSRPIVTDEVRAERAQFTRPYEQKRDALAAQKVGLEKALKDKGAAATDQDRADLKKVAADLKAATAELEKVALPTVWAGLFKPYDKPTVVHRGGDPMKPGDPVLPSSLSVLDKVTKPFELKADAPIPTRRLELAKWIAADDNPLTARVLVNRVWHYHFGTGIVDTPGDFGFLGSKPTHPELLDWLAKRLHETGWRLKTLHRDILLSQAYRQSSAVRDDAARVDRDARLLWRFPPRRLTAEEIRDTLLSVSGRLNANLGGPGFRLYEVKADNVSTYIPLEKFGPETYRRAVYHQNARASVVDLLSDFDLPDNSFAAPRRASTTTPLQALTLLNHSFTIDMAHALADRIVQKAGADDPQAQTGYAYRLLFQHEPSPAQMTAAQQLITTHGLPALCRALLNSNELLYLQ